MVLGTRNTVLLPFFVLLAGIVTVAQQKPDTTFTGYATAKLHTNGVADFFEYGFANLKSQEKYSTETIQNVGSVSKTLIGVSLMIAKEKGLLDLDQNIQEYLDFQLQNPWTEEGSHITLRQLATHTSGIVDNEKYYLKSYCEGERPKMALGEFLKQYLEKGGDLYSKKNFSKAESGKAYTYSNIGAALAAYVIERVSGIPFSEFTKTHILDPLKMEDSGWSYAEIDTAKHAILYGEDDEPLRAYTLITYPDGGFRTSIADLSIYLKELIKGYDHQSNLLKDESWDELFRRNFSVENPVENINPKEPNSGLFMMYSKSGMIGHTGSDPGACCIMWFHPETGEGYIFMANEDLTKQNIASFKNIWKNTTAH